MTKETTYTTHEDDSSDDDTSKETRSKKKTKISRAVPLSVRLETESTPQAPEQRPVLSFGERFMQELQKRAAREQEKLEEQHRAIEDDDEEDDEETSSTVTQKAQKPTANTEEHTDTPLTPDDPNRATYVQHVEAGTIDPLEAADWEHEPEESVGASAEHSDEDPVFVDVPHLSPEAPNEVITAVEPELLEDGLGAEEPPEPPEISDSGPTHPEFGPEGRDTMVPVQESAWYNPVARERTVAAQQQENDDALYRAEKHGLRRGLTAGLLFGWMFGRRGKKQAAEQHKKELKVKEKEVSTLKREQLLAQQRIEAMQRTQENLRANIAEKPTVLAQRPENTVQAQVQSTEAKHAKKAEVENSTAVEAVHNKPRLKAAEIVAMAAAEVVAVTEKTVQRAEADRFVATPEKLKPRTEVSPSLPEEQEITEETYMTSKDRRVESSAWHRIEVDAKTGRPILDPEVAYGEEFKRERRQEIWKDKPGDVDSKSSTGVLGSLAAGALSRTSSNTSTDSANNSDVDQGLFVPQQSYKKSILDEGSQLLKYASSPLVWVVAVVIVLVVFMIGFVR